MSFRNLLSLAFFSFFFLSGCGPDPKTPFPLPPPTEAPPATDFPITTTPTIILIATPIGESTFDGVRVNFIYFEGFLITVGDQRILIDAIYRTHPAWVLKPILESQPPFDEVDLILTTHDHGDHFDPELVLQYLQNNPKTHFVSTPDCVDTILALDNSVEPRLTAIDLKKGEHELVDIDGIGLEAIRLSHNIANVLNLGYIITVDNVTLFHMGDMNPDAVSVSDLQAYGLPEKQIDIAFVHHRLFSDEEYDDYITTGIQANHIIPMHFSGKPPSEFESNLPNVSVIWEPYESWEMP